MPIQLSLITCQDIVDLRKKNWKTKDSGTKGPTTLEEVRVQVSSLT